MIHIGLFEGIGGFSIAAHWMGWDTMVTCEIADFQRKILQHYWPNAYHHTDISTLTYETINEELTRRFGPRWRTTDIILTGGFPCQPFSTAGQRKGTDDPRHLWPEMLRVIREIRPEYIVGENVHGLISWSGGMVFDQVQSDLEDEGYEVIPFVLPACGVNAPHKRDRVWFVAHSNNERGDSGFGKVQREDEEIPKWDNNAEPGNTDIQQTVTNTESQQGERLRPCISEAGWSQPGEFGGGYCWDLSRNSTDTKSHGDSRGLSPLERQNDSQRKPQKRWENNTKYGDNGREWPITDNHGERFQECDPSAITGGKERFDCEADSAIGEPGGWENFPIVPPVLSGNDGLSGLLDPHSISFSKWRNESIKGAGNAVVPQVVFEIFKAIERTRQ